MKFNELSNNSARPTGFRLATPGNWFDLDLNPATRNQSISALVNAREAENPEIKNRRRDIVRQLRQVAREAADGGMVFASMMSELTEGLGMSASATVTVRALTTAQGEGPPENDPSKIEALCRSSASTDDGQSEVGIVDLPVGRSVRVRAFRKNDVRKNDVPGSTDVLMTLVVQYFIPVPASPLLAILTLSTPTVVLAEPFTELFDNMARTFSFEWEAPRPRGQAESSI